VISSNWFKNIEKMKKMKDEKLLKK